MSSAAAITAALDFFLESRQVSALLQREPFAEPCDDRVVIVGAGPVGVRVAQELHRLQPGRPILILGDEPWEPYNRVRLASALAGETAWTAIARDVVLPRAPNVQALFGCRVVAIDRSTREVVDDKGMRHGYDRLVLAVGSHPIIPDVEGIRRAGSFTLRSLSDAQRLAARVVRSRATVVVGGGLLGLEAARGMHRFHTDVTVIDHADRLMSRQLDFEGGSLLVERVREQGMQVVLGDPLQRVIGADAVEAVELRSGRRIACDTLVVAAGIRPNIALAREAGIAVGRGIRVDDRLRTSDPHVFAVGECAEHRGNVYGLVAPGYEMATVAAHVISGAAVSYGGSVVATRLKVLRCPVFSMGDKGIDGLSNMEREVRYSDPARRIYRKIVLNRRRIVGAIGVGEWDELARVQEAISRGRTVLPWQRRRFLREGRLWAEELDANVVSWPDGATVCNCTGVTRGQLGGAVRGGCGSVEALADCTGASKVCGSCKPLLAQLLGTRAALAPVRGAGFLVRAATVCLAAALLLALLPGAPYADSVQWRVPWDIVWREGLWKQVSGYTLGALMLALAMLGLRKRWQRLSLGAYDGWRVVHLGLGVAAVLVLLVHTGGRLGGQLNSALALCTLGLVLAGGVAGWIVGREHGLDPARARPWRSLALWSHILLLWPLPALLGAHVLKTYWF